MILNVCSKGSPDVKGILLLSSYWLVNDLLTQMADRRKWLILGYSHEIEPNLPVYHYFLPGIGNSAYYPGELDLTDGKSKGRIV
jgi:hypothetical protein